MERVPSSAVERRIHIENTWWETGRIIPEYAVYKERAYLQPFFELVSSRAPVRAPVLMGPRRVGKTVLIHQVIQKLIDEGTDPERICYLSIDHPLYNNLSLEDLVHRFTRAAGRASLDGTFVFFDEIQYLKGWEVHLKSLVDSHRNVKFVASGSAAAALRLKSIESGAGRFTDFMLPPLTFFEYLELTDQSSLVETPDDPRLLPHSPDIEALNAAFLEYINAGGYPEIVSNPEIKSDLGRYIKSDIIDKVLLRDLPGLYGISDIQELNALFTSLAYNSGQELSLDQVSKSAGVSKTTIKRYIEYLEAAFLIKVLHRVDAAGKRFQRARTFKVYLTNPSLRAALFSPVGDGDPQIGAVCETAVFAQFFHFPQFRMFYGRWKGGREVDFIRLDAAQVPILALEAKWSDRYFARPTELQGLIEFGVRNGLDRVYCTTKTERGTRVFENLTVMFYPASIYCYGLGRLQAETRGMPDLGIENEADRP
ncbi:MAG: ATP-binding protein [Acidobacteriota bacterium]